MNSKHLFCLVICFVAFTVAAQTDSAALNIIYFNSIHAGGLLGKKGHGSSLTTSTIHGVRYNKVAVGIGIGYDAYMEWRTLPVFVSLGYDLCTLRKNPFFIQLNAGYSEAWNPVVDDDQFIFEADGGLFAHPQLGYRIRSEKFSLYLTAGYKLQHLEYEQTPRWVWPGSRVTIEQNIERLSVQLGLGWH